MPRNQLIRVRRGTAASWVAAQTAAGSTPVLLAGEIGLESDTSKFKFGDGTTLWGALPYAPGGVTYSSGTNAIVDRAINLGGGSAGSLPFQTAANTTSLLGIGATGSVLTVSGGAPTWSKLTASTDYFTTGTSSAQFASILSDETGSSGGGVVVFNSSPAITTPTVSGGVLHAGATSGTTRLQATAVASGVLTLPATTDTIVVQADIANVVRRDSGGTNVNLTGLGIRSSASSVLVLPTTNGTVALTTVTDGFLKADGTIGGGATTMTGNLPLGSNGIQLTSGSVTFPAGSGEVLVSGVNQTSISGNKTFTGTFGVSGSATLSGATTVSGATTLSNASVSLTGITSAGNSVIKINPSTGALSSGKAILTTDVSGILPAANGGFGVDASNAANLAALRALLGIYVQQYQPQGTTPGGNGYIAGYTPQANHLWMF